MFSLEVNDEMEKLPVQKKYRLIGKRLISDVIDCRGKCIIRAGVLMNEEHVLLLHHNNINLADLKVEIAGPYVDLSSKPTNPYIDDIMEMVKTTRSIFQETRSKKSIPLIDVRQHITPRIVKITDRASLFELFVCMQATKQNYVYVHSVSVGILSALIGRWIGLKQSELLQLITAAVLHDIGMVQVSDEIISKPGKLSAEEFDYLKQHTLWGYQLIKETIGTSERHALVALQHHERMDGSGYPNKLKEQQIDIFSRIVAVGDIFHAMISERVYRDPAPFYEILIQMEEHTYGALDPFITRLFIDKIMQTLIGYEVYLTNGEKGRIVMTNPHNPIHPLVHVGDHFIDLSNERHIHIEQVLTKKVETSLQSN